MKRERERERENIAKILLFQAVIRGYFTVWQVPISSRNQHPPRLTILESMFASPSMPSATDSVKGIFYCCCSFERKRAMISTLYWDMDGRHSFCRGCDSSKKSGTAELISPLCHHVKHFKSPQQFEGLDTLTKSRICGICGYSRKVSSILCLREGHPP